MPRRAARVAAMAPGSVAVPGLDRASSPFLILSAIWSSAVAMAWAAVGRGSVGRGTSESQSVVAHAVVASLSLADSPRAAAARQSYRCQSVSPQSAAGASAGAKSSTAGSGSMKCSTGGSSSSSTLSSSKASSSAATAAVMPGADKSRNFSIGGSEAAAGVRVSLAYSRRSASIRSRSAPGTNGGDTVNSADPIAGCAFVGVRRGTNGRSGGWCTTCPPSCISPLAARNAPVRFLLRPVYRRAA